MFMRNVVETAIRDRYPVFLKPYLFIRDYYRAVKHLILKIRNKAIVGVEAKEFCLREELIFPAEKVVLPAIKDVSGRDHKNFGKHEATMPAFYVRSFKNGICYPPREEVYVSGRQVLSEYTFEKTNAAIGTRVLDPSRIRKIKGKVAQLSISGMEINAAHFLLDSLGQLEVIERSSFKPDYYIVAANTPFQKTILGLLGITQEKIIPTHSEELIQADELIVSTFPRGFEYIYYRGYYQNWKRLYVPGWVGDLYKERVLPSVKKTSKKRIYIGRKDARYRKVMNEDEVIAVLSDYGFESISLSNMDTMKQIELFANAEVIVSVHGAGLIDVLFSPPKTRILEIFPQYYHDHGYRLLAHSHDFSYNYLIGKTSDTSMAPNMEDLFIDINELRKAVQGLI